MRYNNYHKHDSISSIFGMPDSATTQEEYIKRSIELGHTNYFTTNHGSFGDIFEAKTLCEKYNIRCIAGIEGYIVPNPLEKDKSNYHIVIIPRTDKARKKMNLISSNANINGFYYKPRIFIDDLLKLDKDDIYITTACEGGILRDDISYDKVFLPLFNHFKENVFLEVQNHITDSQKEINKKCVELSSSLGLRLICANDSHYVDENGMKQRQELLKGKHINYGDEDTYILDYPSYEVMFDRFKKQGVLSEIQIEEGIKNTLIFDDCEEILINKEIKMPNIHQNLTPKQRVELLKERVDTKFNIIKEKENLTSDELKIRLQGIQDEMEVIEDTNDVVHTADYFLFNEINTELAVNKYGGVLTRGGRGSCGSFYINKVLGITQIDRFSTPIPLYSQRFMSKERLLENRALPDIDFNVASQEPFIQASRDLLGENGCYPMIALGTMGESESFRNTCRSMGLDFDEFNDVGKNLDKYRNEEKWKKIILESQKNIGVIVSASVHPCAFILSNENLLEEYGVVKIGTNLCVMITSNEADEYKVLKNDYLIVKVWKLIDETFKLIHKPILDAKTLLDLIKDDKRVWDLYKSGITCTLNQADSDWATQLAMKYGIATIEEASMFTACLRPFFDSWRDSFLSREQYTTGSTHLDLVFKATNSYILFQENLMQYFEWLGVTPSESIGLIKKISKKKIKEEDFKKLEESIKSKWIENTGNIDKFSETWAMIQSCMEYGFCSAHAFATALDMAYGAYLKVNHTLEYYTVCFNNYLSDLDRTDRLINELSYFGITIKSPLFRKSKGEYFYDTEANSIYKGIGSIKFLNPTVGNELYDLKDNTYESFLELLIDIKEKVSINTKQLDLLIKINFFKEFGSIKYLLSTVETFDNFYGKKTLKKDKLVELGLEFIDISKYATDVLKSGKVSETTWSNLNSVGLIKEIISTLPQDEFDIKTILTYQKDILGYIDYVNPELDKRYAMVYSLDDRFATKKCELYCLNNGKIATLKINKKSYSESPFEEGSLIYTNTLEKKFKSKVVGKDAKGKNIYEKLQEMEWWITKATIINEL